MVERVKLDEEWILLIKAAKNLGVSIEEIREFLNTTKKNA
ncbi:anti-repressor SinI family protein [Oceanobacillus luteolus]|uniref:Anti-repressor SinI family protein n=1 Tax=Oceanobacillus luteolus TaxID=1274358 RepID=A0ABW4HR05_9BACI|nr:anti-repressor SinI family protein [Oceanobacillus luteolus]MCM3741844.1 anti-repressor SinI family protein [Oceanobacillus luteolus]